MNGDSDCMRVCAHQPRGVSSSLRDERKVLRASFPRECTETAFRVKVSLNFELVLLSVLLLTELVRDIPIIYT